MYSAKITRHCNYNVIIIIVYNICIEIGISIRDTIRTSIRGGGGGLKLAGTRVNEREKKLRGRKKTGGTKRQLQ